MDAEDSTKDVQDANEEETLMEANAGSKSFHLLNELCDLLMLPKDMLLDRTVRKEVSFLKHRLLFFNSSSPHVSHVLF